MQLTEDIATAAVSIGSGMIILCIFLAIRFDAGVIPSLLYQNIAIIVLAMLGILIRMSTALLTQSQEFISTMKNQTRSKYLKRVLKSLRPFKIKLNFRDIDDESIFLVIMNKVIINYVITLLVSY